MNKISIISAVYNCESFLAETIDSVICQTYENWELILVNDGSTDKSLEVCKKYAKRDPRIIVLSKENGGQASARNMGIQNCSGKLITFLDSDDLYAPLKLERQIEVYKTIKADFYYGAGFTFIDKPDGDRLIQKYEWIYEKLDSRTFFKILFKNCAVNINSVLVRKELFEKIGFFDESEILRGTEDLDFWLRVAENVGTIYGDSQRNVYYRLHEGGIHFQRANMLIGKFIIYQKYANTTMVSRLYRLKETRYLSRELFIHLYDEGRTKELKKYFAEYRKLDRFGFIGAIQALFIGLLSPKYFHWFSTKILYRIGFRLEKFSYILIEKR